MEPHVVVIADTSSTPENAQALGAVLERFAAACRAEPGCLSYEVFRSPTDPCRYLSIERYTDVEAFLAHRASRHFREIGLGELMPLLVDRDVRMYGTPLDVPPVA